MSFLTYLSTSAKFAKNGVESVRHAAVGTMALAYLMRPLIAPPAVSLGKMLLQQVLASNSSATPQCLLLIPMLVTCRTNAVRGHPFCKRSAFHCSRSQWLTTCCAVVNGRRTRGWSAHWHPLSCHSHSSAAIMEATTKQGVVVAQAAGALVAGALVPLATAGQVQM